ncbi:hypothetical protein B0T26DRAFT_750068 [Lasiosphaeria miniovina]|uniref:Uncharacterized protein n=1 Tax=Lasiosphaeria miniovina TaxID=1954250 RepID=A0AA40AVC3_9PEZI|nr:uncharacterized protein B0T26DRAFT_750068 [Lasiosphaeria miniovina]KAK0722698.1 hypothetical protein B0T26DRAFT_750068 [Lasiosphaeria miniovina]
MDNDNNQQPGPGDTKMSFDDNNTPTMREMLRANIDRFMREFRQANPPSANQNTTSGDDKWTRVYDDDAAAFLAQLTEAQERDRRDRLLRSQKDSVPANAPISDGQKATASDDQKATSGDDQDHMCVDEQKARAKAGQEEEAIKAEILRAVNSEESKREKAVYDQEVEPSDDQKGGSGAGQENV